MKKFIQIFGAAALLTASLFTINKTAKAESMKTVTNPKVVFKCEKHDGEYQTMLQLVAETTYKRYPSVKAEEDDVRAEADEPIFTWNNYLGNMGQYTPESRCMTVSARLTNMLSALVAYSRYQDDVDYRESYRKTGERYIQALETLEAVSRSTNVYGTNRFGQFVDEQILVASDQRLNFSSWLKQNITVAGRMTDPDQSVIVTLSPENARKFRSVLINFKNNLRFATGGERIPGSSLPTPIEE